MSYKLLDNANNVRQRRGIVQEFDVFMKVVDDVKKEPKVTNGILSIISFLLIIFLLFCQLYEYLINEDVKYKFSVDTEYDQALKLDIDLIIATPCNNLAIMPMGVQKSKNKFNIFNDFFGKIQTEDELLQKNPSRFEMNKEETKLWIALQKVHKEHFKPGTPLKPVNERTFLGSGIEKGLLFAADEKQRLELDEILNQRKKKQKNNNKVVEKIDEEDNNHILFMIGNGFRVFQVISGDIESKKENEGFACRINGKIPVLKGSGDRLTISVGKSFNIENLFTHFKNPLKKEGNISHRIERFHFGPHIWGLVTPLAGNEQIVETSGIIFQYYIKVVPTKIYSPTSLFTKPETVYQYSVTYAKKSNKETNYNQDSIVFDYEFADIVVEVWPISISITQLILRICAIIGGVVSTSRFIETLFSIYFL